MTACIKTQFAVVILAFVCFSTISSEEHKTLSTRAQYEDASEGEFPGMVSMYYRKTVSATPDRICAGALIHELIVVTAYECFSRSQDTIHYVLMGGSLLSIPYGDPRLQIREVVEARFDNSTAYGAAILRISFPFVRTKTFHAFRFMTLEMNLNDTMQFAGWGNVTASVINLRKIDYKRVNHTECIPIGINMSNVTKSYNCVKTVTPGLLGFCKDELGGPMLFRKLLVGVVTGSSCQFLGSIYTMYGRAKYVYPAAMFLLSHVSTTTSTAATPTSNSNTATAPTSTTGIDDITTFYILIFGALLLASSYIFVLLYIRFKYMRVIKLQ